MKNKLIKAVFVAWIWIAWMKYGGTVKNTIDEYVSKINFMIDSNKIDEFKKEISIFKENENKDSFSIKILDFIEEELEKWKINSDFFYEYHNIFEKIKFSLSKYSDISDENIKNIENHFVEIYVSLQEKTKKWNDEARKIFEKIDDILKNDNWIIFSKDSKISNIQKKYGIVHKTKSEFKDGKTIYSVQQSRINPHLNSPKWQIFKKYLSEKEALKDKENWILVDASEAKNFNLDKSLKNHKTKTLTSPETLKMAEIIWESFLEKTWKKLTVNSLLRTEDLNWKINWASKNSSHIYGSAIDFKVKNLNKIELQTLRNILKKYDRENQIIFIDETAWNSPHFHVTVLNTKKTLNLKFPKYNKIQQNFDKNQTVSEYLDVKKIDNWLDFTTKVILQDIFTKAQIDYMKFDIEQRKNIQENLINFIKYVVYIESSGWQYVENNVSSAKWPFQILDWYKNWTKVSWEWFSTFESWLRTYIKYVNNVKFPTNNLSSTPDFVEKSMNSEWKISPLDLTQEQSINLFLVWQFLWDDKEKAEKLMKIILLWNTEEARKFYFEDHHTNPDENTKILEEKSAEIYFPKIKKII